MAPTLLPRLRHKKGKGDPFLVSEPWQQAPTNMLSLPVNTLALLPLFSDLHLSDTLLNCLYRPPAPLRVISLPTLGFPSQIRLHLSQILAGGMIAVQSVGKITWVLSMKVFAGAISKLHSPRQGC